MEINIIQRGLLKLSWKLLIYAAILLTIFLNILTVATVSTPYKNDETSLFEYSLCLEEKGNDNFLSNENKKSDHSTYCKILIHWNFNDSHVWFEMEAETLGYITFGFSSTPNLIHSDVIIAWITTNGTIYFRDSYMINDNLPLTDEYQDYQYSGKQNSTHTLLNFVRKRDTCDSMDFRLTPDTIYLHWSYHSSDPDISDSQNSFLFHGLVRGVRPVNLFNRYPNDFSKYGIEQIGYNNNIGNSTRSNTATIDKDSDGRKMGAETVRTFDLSIKVNTKTNNDELNKLKILSFASPYLCQLFKLPILSSSLNVDKKYHIIKRKLTIKSPNIMYSTPGYKIGNQVHDRDHDGEDTIKNAVKDKALKHAVLYSCSRDVDFSQTFPDLEGNIFPCYQQSFPAEMFYCNDIVTGYTLGGDEEFYWPPEAGHSMGTSSDAEYVMLELLIDQTKIPLSEISGVDEKARYEMGNTASKNEKDNLRHPVVQSLQYEIGFQLSYTDKVRRFDAGVLSTGPEPTDWFFFPPGIENLVVDGHCNALCTALDFPKKGIQIYATQFYTHGDVAKIHSIQARNGREVAYIARDDNYVTEYQNVRYLERVKIIKPGDHIITRCHYDTRSITSSDNPNLDKINTSKHSNISTPSINIKKGDESGNAKIFRSSGIFWYQRPCMQFLFYYPKLSKLASCKSEPVPSQIYNIFKSLPKIITGNDSYITSTKNVTETPSKKERGRQLGGNLKSYNENELNGKSIYEVTMEPNNQPPTTFYEYLNIFPWSKQKLALQNLKKIYAKGDYVNLCRDVNRSPIAPNVEKRHTYPTIYQNYPEKVTVSCAKPKIHTKYRKMHKYLIHKIARNDSHNNDIIGEYIPSNNNRSIHKEKPLSSIHNDSGLLLDRIMYKYYLTRNNKFFVMNTTSSHIEARSYNTIAPREHVSSPKQKLFSHYQNIFVGHKNKNTFDLIKEQQNIFSIKVVDDNKSIFKGKIFEMDYGIRNKMVNFRFNTTSFNEYRNQKFSFDNIPNKINNADGDSDIYGSYRYHRSKGQSSANAIALNTLILLITVSLNIIVFV